MTLPINIISHHIIKYQIMKHVAIYVRVSTSEQTVENQRIRLVEFAEKQNYTYNIYEEVESTRKTRPVKQALLSKLRNKEYDAVLVYKLDRWARSSTELILDTKELIDKSRQNTLEITKGHCTINQKTFNLVEHRTMSDI